MNDTKTPCNPSKRATARVKNPLPMPTECPCCNDWNTGKPSTGCIEVVSNDEIYGRLYGDWPYAVICHNCEAYVGLHPFTNIPLGTLADAPIRHARKTCKEPFEALHRTGKLTRSDAYQKLADKLGIDVGECHFGWFSIDMCKKAESAAREIYLGT